MIYIDNENLEIIMLKNYMQENANTNKREIESMKHNLKKAINKLSKRQKEILKKYFFEEQKEKEIAKELGITIQGVNKVKRKALRNLKDILVA